jgi:LmbE family N-acetylglucosaminyl deacetylase
MQRDVLTRALDDGVPLIVLSPHLDDAVLSCGALISHARRRLPVTVVTVFTQAGSPPHTLSGRRCLRISGMADAHELYKARCAEDRRLLERMGVTCLHAGFTEALFRVKRPAGSALRRRASRLCPELAHVYATYRLHVTSGRVATRDATTVIDIARVIDEAVARQPGLILAPLGVGGHVDHVLVRTAAGLCGGEVGYYSEFPYNLRHRPDAAFVRRHGLAPMTWESELAAKPQLVRAYATQADGLFPGGRIPLVPEVYLLPSKASPPSRKVSVRQA